jgi:glutamine synthetase
MINGKTYGGRAKEQIKIGVDVLPRFPNDTTDRNRTSPFAFTGNKFEFRMPGSSCSIALPNTVLNTAVAETLRQFADILEKADDFNNTLDELIKKTIKEHKRIIFNGNGYDEAWICEAVKERGLLNLKSTPDCLPYFLHDKNIRLFTQHKVLSEVEMHSRYEIMLENYCKTLNIEALTMIEMARREILPAVIGYMKELSETALSKKSLIAGADCDYEEKTIAKLSSLASAMYYSVETLEKDLGAVKEIEDAKKQALEYRDRIIAEMQELRTAVDEAECITAQKYWPYPTYGELLFGVR